MNVPVLLATVANLAIAVATYAYYGIHIAAGATAARNTARFSSVVFAVALAAHVHPRFGNHYVALLRAFVAAHIVHFATVIAYHWMIFKLDTPMFWGIASTGFLLLAATALTLTKMPRTHLALTYVIALAFAIALGSGLGKYPFANGPLVALLFGAIVIHATNAFRARGATRAASA